MNAAKAAEKIKALNRYLWIMNETQSMLNPISVNELIRNRRSVFVAQFEQDKPVPEEIILEILENANTAPTHKFTEPWRFVVYSGDGLKTLAEEQAALYKSTAGDKFKQGKYDQLRTNPLLCSHVIAIGCKRNADKLPEMEEIAAVSCAVENIYLSLEAYGLGGYWSTGGITFYDEAKPLFGLDDTDVFMGFFYIGYVKTPSVKRTPGSLADKVKWVKS